jgi:hypothetical protein
VQLRIIVFLIYLGLLIAVRDACATIYHSKQEAMELAFGKGAQVETLSLFLTEEQLAEAEKRARVKLDSKLYSFYAGKRDGTLLGYAAIESATVRTQPETLLIVLTPAGQLQRIVVLAFHEPPEYQPPDRWFGKLQGRGLDELELNRGVDTISGASMSTRSALGSVRKVLALYQIGIEKK